MNSKGKQLIEFYRKCTENGYVDMRDEVQSLKAKVIAKDLNLSYRNIEKLYDSAKLAAEEDIKAKKAEAEAEEIVRKKRILAEKNKDELNKNAKLAMTLRERGEGDSIDVYIRDDRTYCYTYNNSEKRDGDLRIDLRKGGIIQTKINPSKLVYTGASVGGITMGGVHKTEETISGGVVRTEKGYINVNFGEKSFSIDDIYISDYFADLYKRDDVLIKYGKHILCNNPNADVAWFNAIRPVLFRMDITERDYYASKYVDDCRRPYTECQEIFELVNKILTGVFPETDEELYEKALELSVAESMLAHKQAVRIFEKIIDYKDSSQQLKKIKLLYEDEVQKHKEEEVIKAEKQHALIKRAILIAAVVIAIVIGALIVYELAFVPKLDQKAKAEISNNGVPSDYEDVYYLYDNVVFVPENDDFYHKMNCEKMNFNEDVLVCWDYDGQSMGLQPCECVNKKSEDASIDDLNWLYRNIGILTEDDSTYFHRIDCEETYDTNLYVCGINDAISFKGYRPCPKCIK